MAGTRQKQSSEPNNVGGSWGVRASKTKLLIERSSFCRISKQPNAGE